MNTLTGQTFENQRVIVRVDFNVPMDENFQVTDNTRIEAAKQTIDYILDQGGRCILLSHFGRPTGREAKFSLKHILKTVSETLQRPVHFCSECVGPEATVAVNALGSGELILMENVRFHKEETAGDTAFAEALAALGDVYVNDAFGAAHRTHASTAVIAQFFDKEKKYFGKLLEKEVMAIQTVLKDGKKPVLGILGGAKVSSKITIIENLLDAVDELIIGGGMVYTFVKAQGGNVGNSICEKDYCDYALTILEKAKEKNVQIHLPVDVIAGDDFANNANQKICDVTDIPKGWEGMDAGPKTLAYLEQVVAKSKTILWNGPIGVFEFPHFAKGTIALGTAIAKATKAGAFSLVGGGDSVAAVKKFNFQDQMSYVSTGGGAMLESLEGKKLPGIVALTK